MSLTIPETYKQAVTAILADLRVSGFGGDRTACMAFLVRSIGTALGMDGIDAESTLRWLLLQLPVNGGGVPSPAPQPTPVPVPVPTPGPGPSGSLIRARLFGVASGCPLPSAINTGVAGPLAWAQSHGQAKENEYRVWELNGQQAAGSHWMPYIVDGYFGDPFTSVIAMCLSDMGHPDGNPNHHAVPAEGWYDRCIAKGVTGQIAILRDSPKTNVPATKDSIVRLVAYYHNSRFQVIYLTGLECDRNRTVAQTAQDVRWLQELAPGKRILAGSANPDYLLAVAAGAPGVELWLEQPTSLMAQPLTNSTANSYMTNLDRLANKVGNAKTWAGEWWMTSAVDCKTFSARVLAAGYNCGGGYQA